MPESTPEQSVNDQTSNDSQQSTRELFIAAGNKVLAEVGPEKISLRAVAKQANLSAMAPYRHFSSKEGLLAELARQGFVKLGLAVRLKCPDDLSSLNLQHFKAMAKAYIGFADGNPELYRLMFSGIIPDFCCYPQLKTDADWSFQILQDAIVQLQEKQLLRADNPRLLAHHCWSLMHGFVNLSLDGVMNALSDEELTKRFSSHIDLIISGLKAPE